MAPILARFKLQISQGKLSDSGLDYGLYNRFRRLSRRPLHCLGRRAGDDRHLNPSLSHGKKVSEPHCHPLLNRPVNASKRFTQPLP